MHAARVRGFHGPWWLKGHTWVKVEISGHELNACASSPANRVGAVGFTPLTRELPLRRVTRWALGLALVPFVAGTLVRSWFLKRPLPAWIHRESRSPAS